MQKSDLQQITPFEAQELVIEELCHAHHKGDGSTLDKNIERLWKTIRGTSYHPRDSLAMSLVGGPQTSKTFSFSHAAKQFANAVGLDFVSNPDDKQTRKLVEKDALKHSFVYIRHEFAGEMSAMTVNGIPSTTDVGDSKYMTNVPLLKFATLEQSAGGLLLLDDLANAGVNVRNALLPLLQFKQVGSLDFSGKYVGTTRNRGALDGTNTSKTSSAEVSRGPQFEVLTSADGWLEYVLPHYSDSPSTALIIDSFMFNHGHEFFYKPPLKGGDQSWPGPRTWENALTAIDTEMRAYEELVNAGLPFDRILKKISYHVAGSCGVETAAVFSAHANAFLKGALPCAMQQMKDGEFSGNLKKLFTENVIDKANTPDGASFATNYAYALANEATKVVINELESGKDITKDKAHFKVLLKNFVDGVYNHGMHEDKMSLAMTKFKDQIVESTQSKHRLGRVNSDGMTVVNDEFLRLMTEVVGANQVARMAHPDLPGAKIYDVTFSDVFSNSSRMERDFSRAGLKKEARDYFDVMEKLDNLAAETPRLSDVLSGAPATPKEEVVDLVERATEIEKELVEETTAEESKSSIEGMNEDLGVLDKMLDDDSVDKFSLEQEKDGVQKTKVDAGITDIDMEAFDNYLDIK